jgi:hypothetical protein
MSLYVRSVLLAALLLAPSLAAAQGLDAEGARDTIIDAPVVTEEKPVEAENTRITEALAKGAENATEVRKRFQVGKVDIVFVPGLTEEGSPLADAISSHADSIEALRKEIEGSAIFYHAIDSQQVLLRDIVAVEFGAGDEVTIFVAKASAI